MRSVELFTGAGGLAIGTAQAGFKHTAVIERDKYCCETIRENQHAEVWPLSEWWLFHGDVSTFNFRALGSRIGLLAAGPPCQPFSLAGKHRGHRDERNMFPEVVRAVRELQPRAILVENVKGLLRTSFADYFGYIIQQLSFPEIIRRVDEDWKEHSKRLDNHRIYHSTHDLSYRVTKCLLNAADYGVPQRRERVFIVGFRSDLNVDWTFPMPTHSRDALLWDQWVTGDYWERHGIAAAERPACPEKYRSRVERIDQTIPQMIRPWRTVRDAIDDLPGPEDFNATTQIANHVFVDGARSYPGHTGSPIDEPAKTLKAGDHGVPGGENMLAEPDGSVRYFTVREAARLQTFPDNFIFHGSWTETMRQLGNAVPVALAQAVAEQVMQALVAADTSLSRVQKEIGFESRAALQSA